MGFPSAGKEALYRNPASEVVRFFSKRHGEEVWTFNLCSERGYDSSLFGGRASVYPSDDHNPPPFGMLRPFCEEASQWLRGGSERVVAVHCKAGKGRTGVFICALLLYMRAFPTAGEALRFYGDARTRNGKGVTIPSQIRFVTYFGNQLKAHEKDEAAAGSGSSSGGGSGEDGSDLSMPSLASRGRRASQNPGLSHNCAHPSVLPMTSCSPAFVAAFNRGSEEAHTALAVVDQVGGNGGDRGSAPPSVAVEFTGLTFSAWPNRWPVPFNPVVEVICWPAGLKGMVRRSPTAPGAIRFHSDDFMRQSGPVMDFERR